MTAPMSDSGAPVGEKETLAERLGATAAVARAERDRDRAEAARVAAEKYEQQVAAGAIAFRDARLQYLPDLLQGAADNGQFAHEVWSEDVDRLNHSARDIHQRGLALVADWLREQGFIVDIEDRNYAMENDSGTGGHKVTLIARWEAPTAGRPT